MEFFEIIILAGVVTVISMVGIATYLVIKQKDEDVWR